MKVRVSSYQSIASAEIEAAGFTAITGPSNIGKSALLRAIAGALFGQEGDHFVRKGEAACVVAVEHGGHTVEWQKVRKKRSGLESCVVVDGEKFTRLGKGHAELTAGLGFAAIRAGGSLIRPQVAFQHDAIFLLTETPNAAAEVFKMLGRIDVVTRAQGSAKSDLRKAHSEHEIRERDQEAAFEATCQLGWVPLQVHAFGVLEGRLGALSEMAADAERAAGTVGALGALGDPRELPEPPELPEVDPIERLLEKIREAESLVPLGTIPETPEFTDSSTALEQATRALSLIRDCEAAREAVTAATISTGEVDYELGEARERRHQLEVELGACPTCGREFA